MKKKITPIVITIILGTLLYYFMLPPLNISAPEFYLFSLVLLIIYYISLAINELKINNNIITILTTKHEKNTYEYHWLLLVPIVFVLIILINIVNLPMFNSTKYYERIDVKEDGVFQEDVSEVNFNSLPLLDKDSSRKLGDRVMGQMTELVSQFSVSNLYTQINYKNDIVRVTPLEYANVVKYFTNRKGGVKGYIILNSVSGKSELVKLDKGMKYMPSALFNENLYRKLRFSYPTEILGKETFEIDNNGNPYWIVPTIKYSGVGLRRDVSGVIILDPITGKTSKYEIDQVPTWVDHVYPTELILEQVNDWGQYKTGYINSIFGQKGVVATTSGYNYTVMNDDVYLYTGITSVASDESNIGFILTNLRTKKTVFYSVSGAEEYSAMASAEGQVQQMQYQATFPLLINLNNKPTYLLSLKDKAGLIKMYAFIDVADYQKVVVTDATDGIKAAALNYLRMQDRQNREDNITTKDIVISKLTSALIDGTSYYYFVDSQNNKYRVSIKVKPYVLPFIEVGQKINISYHEDNEIYDILKINNY